MLRNSEEIQSCLPGIKKTVVQGMFPLYNGQKGNIDIAMVAALNFLYGVSGHLPGAATVAADL